MKNRHIIILVVTAMLLSIIRVPAFAKDRTIQVSGLRSTELHVVSQAGTLVVPQASFSVTVTPQKFLVVRTPGPVRLERLQENMTRWKLPYRFYGVDRSGVNFDLDVVVDVDMGGMTYVAADKQFEGRLYIGLVDVNDPTSTRTLPQVTNVQITGSADRIDPAAVRIVHSNLPFEAVRVFASNPGDSISLSFRFTFSSETLEKSLKVIRPTLTIEASPDRINGLGLQTSTIVVRLENTEDLGGQEVTLDTDLGGLETVKLQLDDRGIGETKIRSIGTGEARITAKCLPAAAVARTVRFTWPWAFLVCATVGGGIGAAIRLLAAGKKPQARKANNIVVIGAGVLIGLVVATAYTVGVNLASIQPDAKVGEAVVFVLAAVGSYIGKISVPQSPAG